MLISAIPSIGPTVLQPTTTTLSALLLHKSTTPLTSATPTNSSRSISENHKQVKVLLSLVATALTAVVSLSVYGSDTIHIAAYNGNEEIQFAFQWGEQNFFLISRNNIGNGFSRGYGDFGWIFPVYSNLKGFINLVSGYGQSISSYSYYNNSTGIGFVFQQ